MDYSYPMFSIITTKTFDEWFQRLDGSVRVRVQTRIDNVSNGHFGDHKVFGSLGELRFKSGIRVYYMRHRYGIVILLSGGNKDSRKADFEAARKMIKAIKEEV